MFPNEGYMGYIKITNKPYYTDTHTHNIIVKRQIFPVIVLAPIRNEPCACHMYTFSDVPHCSEIGILFKCAHTVRSMDSARFLTLFVRCMIGLGIFVNAISLSDSPSLSLTHIFYHFLIYSPVCLYMRPYCMFARHFGVKCIELSGCTRAMDP